jgi:hypothetical protein
MRQIMTWAADRVQSPSYMASFHQPLRSLALASLLAFGSSVVSGPRVRAQAPGVDSKTAAAAAFDAGVTAYTAGDFRAATAQFLRADDAQPNASALANALASARHTGEPELLANVAARILSREAVPAEVVSDARAALAEVAPHVSELVVRCEAEPCEPMVDGERWPPETRYVAPGPHQVTARAPGFVGEEVTCSAGAPCSVSLTRAPQPGAEVPTAPAVGEPAPAAEPAQEAPPRVDRPGRSRLPLAVFVTSGVATLTLAALGTWTGLQALHERDKYDSEPASYDRDRTKQLALSTDLLLAGSLLCAGATVATGLWWVDWKSYGKSRVVASARGDVLMVHRLTF